MLKLQSNNEYQRRPTRISAAICEPHYKLPASTTSATSVGNGSTRLKSSTIAKVPSAKSRLQQPVASTLLSNEPISTAPTQQKPPTSRLARPTGGSQAARDRPSSLALNIKSAPAATSRVVGTLIPAKVCSSTSILPKLTHKKLETTGKSNASPSSRPQIASGETKYCPVNSKATVKRKCTTATTTVIKQGTSAGRTSASSTKNLVAVVHPQHSQRVNLSATTTTTKVNNNKLSLTTTKSTTTTSTTNTTRFETAKVNSNHKDVNGREREERRESKQDESQIVVAAPRSEKTTTATFYNSASAHGQTNGFTSITKNGGDKNDQFVQSNNAYYLKSVAPSKSDHLRDKKQHGNNKQSNEHLPSHTHSTMTTTTTQTDGDDDEEEDDDDQQTNNCYNHDGAKSTLTKSPAIYFKRNINASTHAINDRILPKPMGQQVLSLMMLDVGLLPANNHQQQHISPPKRSHVRLPSPDRQLAVGSFDGGSNANSYFNGNNGQSSFSHEKDPVNRLNGGGSSSIIDHKNNYEQCNNYHSLQPTHDMLRLQVRFSNQDNENLRSISLPSSPRLGVHSSSVSKNNRRDVDRGGHDAEEGQVMESSIRQPAIHHTLLGHEDFRRAKEASPVSRNQLHSLHKHTANQNQLLSVCDSQDSHSMTSSSCSSLNHCPPLLALSDQLNGLKLEELVRANVDLAVKQHKQNNPIAENSGTIQDTVCSSDQVAQVAKQHEILTNDLNSVEIEAHRSNKIDHVEASCAQQPEDLFATEGKNFREQAPETSNCNRNSQVQANEILRCDESFSDPQLRRQQQPRSHSISGQEFHSNGQYQRLKQSIYTQQGVFDGNLHCNPQSNNRIHQISSSYQQNHLVGRSPSPLSVNCQTHYGSPQRDGSIKYPPDRQPRSQLHASLECLNTTNYSDYHPHQLQQLQHLHQQQQQQQIQQHQYQQQQQQQQIHNQHYAASYILSTPPANTIINQNGDQDLAAAAMGAPPSQYHSIAPASASSSINVGSYNHQTQNLINRAMAQVSQSPLRRLGMNNASVTGVSSGLLNHMSSLHHPMRAGHSSLSLASSSYIIEDKLQNEIRKLHSDLKSEKEKNEALNSQLNINSSLMSAFEQSLTTLNTRLRQLTTLNEKKDNEIEELKEKLSCSKLTKDSEKKASPNGDQSPYTIEDDDKSTTNSEKDIRSEQNLTKIIEDLKRQLIEKDRLLTDTRLEALSAAHQLEQLESKLNGEHSLLINEDELDEGVMVVNHSPSDSDAITDSAHFSEMNNQISKCNQRCDNTSFMLTNNNNNIMDSSIENNNTDDQSNHSSDYQIEVKTKEAEHQHTMKKSFSQQFDESDSGVMGKLMDSLLLTS